jgi:hypothetical protein
MATSGLRFLARFDPDVWEQDLARSTAAGRSAAERARKEYERQGAPRRELRPMSRLRKRGGRPG